MKSPDGLCTFSDSEDGLNFISIGLPYVARQDRWIGAKIGLFCTSKTGVRNEGYAEVIGSALRNRRANNNR